ncbi:MAG: recombination mediator RecR, partial [Ignavibacteria bacterium]
EDEICEICKRSKRDKALICVVEEASDVIAIEKSHEYNRIYHVLGGVLSPLTGIGPEHLKIKELIKRFEMEEISEVILAMNPDTEGEATSLYLAKLIKPLGIKVSRIARGLPVGGDLEFADEATIGRAVNSRTEI